MCRSGGGRERLYRQVCNVCLCMSACVCEGERRDSANYVCVSGVQPFFPTSYLIKGCNHKASRCSIHIASLPPFLVPPRSLPSRALPSAEETPAGETEALQHGKKALRSPPLLVRCHTTLCPPPTSPFSTVTAPHALTLFLPGEQKMCVGVCVWIVARGWVEYE